MFAPTNAAFQALEANLGYTPDQLLASSILAPTLKYHVVPGVAAQVRVLSVCCEFLCLADLPFYGAGMLSTVRNVLRGLSQWQVIVPTHTEAA